MIKILCVGKIKERYLEELIFDYQNRINKYIKLEIKVLKDNVDCQREMREIIKNLKTNDYNIALDLKGKKLNSIDFANMISNTLPQNSNITFVIGGSNGLNKEVLSLCQDSISFSDLTFPHGLFRGILLEQIYRACKINNNETYHK